uniref:CARD domain-containing protein n=1 Tax=Oreochromis niloticus TaxID=8128 RepID=A0A669F9R5_ORENI
MKCLFKNRHLKEKKREISKVGDDPISEGKTEEDTNYAFKSHDEEGEEDVRTGCCFFPRRPSCRTYRSGAEISLGGDDHDGVCYRNFSVPTEKHFSESRATTTMMMMMVFKIMKTIMMTLTDSTSSHSVWKRAVYLSSSGVKKCRDSVPWNLSPDERLLNVRSGFIDGISEPVLNSLLDKLLEKKVIIDAELEAGIMQNRSDRARFVIDIVRKKGEAASSQMIEVLCYLDSYFCKSLRLI